MNKGEETAERGAWEGGEMQSAKCKVKSAKCEVQDEGRAKPQAADETGAKSDGNSRLAG